MAVIHSEIDKDYIRKIKKKVRDQTFGNHIPELTEEEIDNCVRIVGRWRYPFIKL